MRRTSAAHARSPARTDDESTGASDAEDDDMQVDGVLASPRLSHRKRTPSLVLLEGAPAVRRRMALRGARPVPRPAHPPRTAQPTMDTIPPEEISQYCSFCVTRAEPAQLLTCAQCHLSGHQRCLKFSDKLWRLCKQQADWACIECKICSACQTAGNDVRGGPPDRLRRK